MAGIAINDLPTNRALDVKAMSSVRGASAPWVFGWITPFTPPAPLFPVVNFYQINNNSFFVGQMIDQSQTVKIDNSGANSTINAVLLGFSNAGELQQRRL